MNAILFVVEELPKNGGWQSESPAPLKLLADAIGKNPQNERISSNVFWLNDPDALQHLAPALQIATDHRMAFRIVAIKDAMDIRVPHPSIAATGRQ
jgi:hypothetical protein